MNKSNPETHLRNEVFSRAGQIIHQLTTGLLTAAEYRELQQLAAKMSKDLGLLAIHAELEKAPKGATTVVISCPMHLLGRGGDR